MHASQRPWLALILAACSGAPAPIDPKPPASASASTAAVATVAPSSAPPPAASVAAQPPATGAFELPAGAVFFSSHGPCRGTCRAARTFVFEDGTVTSEAFVDGGSQKTTRKVGADRVAALLGAFRAASFFALEEMYFENAAPDYPDDAIAARADGRTHLVRFSKSATVPQVVLDLETKLDALIDAAR